MTPADVQALLKGLEALRDKMHAWMASDDCDAIPYIDTWIEDVGVLLHGAGHSASQSEEAGGLQHEPGCPAIADDESDYEHLMDAGTCVCRLSKRK